MKHVYCVLQPIDYNIKYKIKVRITCRQMQLGLSIIIGLQTIRLDDFAYELFVFWEVHIDEYGGNKWRDRVSVVLNV